MIRIKDLNLIVGNRYLKFEEDLIFPSGSVSFVKGVSGAGKTTLLYVLGMISKQKGYVYYFNGKKVTNKEKMRKEHIGMMYQNFNMLEDLSLYENIKLFSDMNGCLMNRQEAISLLQKFSLSLELDRPFSTLSGGEKQRFCLACILAKNPSVIIADEPTSALDKDNADQLMNILYTLAKQEGKTIIVSTHSKDYDHLADNIMTLYENKVLQTSVLKENQWEKHSFRKMNPRFYLEMTKQRLRRMVKSSGLVIAFMILALTMSTFLIRYGQSSEEEYTYYMNESLENEAFLTPSDYLSELSEEALEYIRSIPGIENVYTIKTAFGTAILPNGEEITPIQVFSVYPFQKTFKDGQCKGDSMIYRYQDQEIKLIIDGFETNLEVAGTYTSDKILKYSMNDLPKLFISADLFELFTHSEMNQYVMEIRDFSVFDNITMKIGLVTEDYVATSAFRHFALLLDNLKQQQTMIYFTSILLTGISFILFVMVQIHEVQDKKREMCIFQANGLNKKHIFYLELLEYLMKFILFYCLSYGLSHMFTLFVNQFILDTIKMTIDLAYMKLLLMFLLAFITLPGIVFMIYFLRQSPEDELRAIN